MPEVRCLPLLVAGALLLAGCGGDTKPSETTAADVASKAAAPATGAAITGTGYELHAADGWTDVKQQLSSTADVILATEHGSIMNVVRERVPADAGRSALLADLTRSVLDGADATKQSATTPIVVDGAAGVTFGIHLKTDLGDSTGRVVIVVHDGYAYALASSSAPAEPKPTAAAFAAMLSSWRWT